MVNKLGFQKYYFWVLLIYPFLTEEAKWNSLCVTSAPEPFPLEGQRTAFLYNENLHFNTFQMFNAKEHMCEDITLIILPGDNVLAHNFFQEWLQL